MTEVPPRTFYGTGSFAGAHDFVVKHAVLMDVNIPIGDRLKEFYKLCSSAAIFDSDARGRTPKCLEGTARTSLAQIRNWDMKRNGSPVFWLSGPVGMGKSVIAQTMAEEWAANKRPIVTFFFSPQVQGSNSTPPLFQWIRKLFNGGKNEQYSDDTNDREPLILTLAYQLATRSPDYEEHILSTIQRDPSILDAVMSKQFSKLIIRPLEVLHQGPYPLIVLVDALDECRNGQTQLDFLALVASYAAKQRWVRFFISSRPDGQINNSMQTLYEAKVLEEIRLTRTTETDNDIEKYLRKEFSSIGKSTPTFHYDDGIITKLVDRSSGQFIFASTIAKYVGDIKENPSQRLEDVLGSTVAVQTSTKPYQNLDALYFSILLRSGANPRTLVSLLGHILSTKGALTLAQLDKLCSLPEGDSMVKLRLLRSLLKIPLYGSDADEIPIQILHASFEEFLTDPARSHQYYVNPAKINSAIMSSWLSAKIARLYNLQPHHRPLASEDYATAIILERLKQHLLIQSMSPFYFILFTFLKINPFVYVELTLRFCTKSVIYLFSGKYCIGGLASFIFSLAFFFMTINFWPLIISSVIGSRFARMIVSKLFASFLHPSVIAMAPLLIFCFPAAVTFTLFLIRPSSVVCRFFANIAAIVYVWMALSSPLLALFYYCGVFMPVPLQCLKICITSFAFALWVKPLVEYSETGVMLLLFPIIGGLIYAASASARSKDSAEAEAEDELEHVEAEDNEDDDNIEENEDDEDEAEGEDDMEETEDNEDEAEGEDDTEDNEDNEDETEGEDNREASD